jgi:hypothetical protein
MYQEKKEIEDDNKILFLVHGLTGGAEMPYM